MDDKSSILKHWIVRPRVKMADVARAAQVSTMTVSNTFKSPEKVVPETRVKVLEAAARLGYIHNAIAGSFGTGRSQTIAVTTPSIRNSDFADMIMGLEAELEGAGYHLIISIIDRPDREYDAIHALIRRRVDGIVMAGVDRDPATRTMLEQAGVPVVETWDVEGPFIDMGVGFDSRRAAYDASRMLLESGRKRIGSVAYDRTRGKRYSDRLAGFQQAMAEAGLADDLVATVPSASGFYGGKQGLGELLAKAPDLDGVFCHTDILAAGVHFGCAERNIRVPEQLALVGFGDYEVASSLPHGLSSVRTPGEQIGRTAARMLLKRHDGERLDVVDLGYSLVRRGSC